MAKTKSAPLTQEPEGAAMPTRIMLTCPYGFYEDDGTYRAWAAGSEITDANDITLLVGRQAEHEDITDTE